MPELYAVVGSILRDITQARCMSDLYSRDVSQHYAEDRVLRYFPVPRAEISEAAFTLSFVINGVTVDTSRENTRNARISQLFERFASDLVRSALQRARKVLDELKARNLTDEQRAALVAFENGFFSEDYRNIFRARLVRYFEDQRAVITSKGSLPIDETMKRITEFIEGLSADPRMETAMKQFKADVDPSFKTLLTAIREKLEGMSAEFKEANDSQDFKIDINVDPAQVKEAGQSVCTISVKATVRNYTWSKVDEDPEDFHSLRTLQPE
jgi:hypothetical protein